MELKSEITMILSYAHHLFRIIIHAARYVIIMEYDTKACDEIVVGVRYFNRSYPVDCKLNHKHICKESLPISVDDKLCG